MSEDELPAPNGSTPTVESSARGTRPPVRSRAGSAKSKRTFEQAIADVEEIVSKLESGKLELATSLDEYQRGIGALKECYDLLGSAERRITLLSGFDIEGNPVREPFGEQPMSTAEKQASRPARRSSKQQVILTDPDVGDDLENDEPQAELF